MGVVEVGPSTSGRPGVGDKGLKDALGFVSSCVIGVGLLLHEPVLWRIEHKEFFRRKREVVGAPRAGPTVTE